MLEKLDENYQKEIAKANKKEHEEEAKKNRAK
jgi:hypothetical protein